MIQEPAELSLWPHGIIAENSSLVRKKKSHVEKSSKTSITKKQNW